MSRDPLLGLAPDTIDADVPLDELGFDEHAMFGAIESEVARTRTSPLAKLRELRTGTRVVLTSLGTAGLATLVGVTACRTDLASYSTARLVLESLLLVATLVLTMTLALRPAHRPELDRPRLALALLASLAVAFVLAVVPTPIAPRVALGPIAPPDWSAGLPCLTVGMLVAIPCFLVARLFDRGTGPTAYLAAGAAGVAANLALTLHCPLGDVGHRVSTHASQGVLILLCLAVAAGIERLVPKKPVKARES